MVNRKKMPASSTILSTLIISSGALSNPRLTKFRIISILFHRHVAVGWGVVEDTLKTEVERRKENVGKRVTKVKLLGGVHFHNKQTGRFP